MIRVKDLRFQTGDEMLPGERPFLRCEVCGEEASANRGDYFGAAYDHIFVCCGEAMKLVIKRTVFEEVKP